MVKIHAYMESLLQKMRAHFGDRLRYMGLQGSFLRGEASEFSDIDVMVLLDGLTVADMDAYRRILQEVGHYDLSCGFICSTEDIRCWNKLELCHVLHTTKDYYGTLSDFISDYSREDVRQFTLMSVNNVYHALCHSYIHSGAEESYKNLPGLFKGCFFILQSLTYLKTGEYVGTKRELLEKLEGSDKKVLEYAMGCREDGASEKAFRLLFDWCAEKIRSV